MKNKVRLKKFAIDSKKTGSVSYGIGDTRIGGDGRIYKYMTIHSALLCFDGNNIMFQEISNWQDKYESRFYTADYQNLGNPQWVNNKVYACCFTRQSQNEAAWKVYASYTGNDDEKYCVQLRLRRVKLRKILNEYAYNNNMKLCEGLVKYEHNRVIEHLHEKQIVHKDGTKEDNEDYKYYFDDFREEDYLQLLLIKRKAFEHEKEIRFFLIPNESKGDSKIFPNIEWSKLIEEIKIDENTPPYLVEFFKEKCLEYGIDININTFDVYAMKETSPIIIE